MAGLSNLASKSDGGDNTELLLSPGDWLSSYKSLVTIKTHHFYCAYQATTSSNINAAFVKKKVKMPEYIVLHNIQYVRTEYLFIY